MEIQAVDAKVLQESADWLVLGLYQNQPLTGALADLDRALAGAIQEALTRGDWKPELLHMWHSYSFGKVPARRILIMGLGTSSDFTLNDLRRVAGQAVQTIEHEKGADLLLLVPEGDFAPNEAAQAVTEGMLLGSWQFSGYKRDGDPRTVPSARLTSEKVSAHILAEGVERGRIVGHAQNLTRELGWRPSNFLYPETFAQIAQERGRTLGLEVEILDPERMAELGMGGILGVGQGSVYSPRMVILRYRGGGNDSRTLALVGKGITFDSGGISLKPAQAMDEMKYDMLGAGAVMGAMCAIAQLKPAINVIGILGLAQNMPSGSSYKPGDVIKAFNGKTIEILNTDAEGRVVLSDAVSYAVHLGADWIVETSTLTGAALIALGHEASALVTTNQAFADTVVAASAQVGERVWQLPAYPEFKELYKSEIADLNNSPGRDAGTITAGMIVSEFAGEVPFVHLDIAGTGWTKKGPLNAKEGATGVMVRTFTRLAEQLSQS